MSFTTTNHHHDGLSSAAAAADRRQKQVRSWQMFRSAFELLLPSCNCTLVEPPQDRPRTNRNCNRKRRPTNPTNLFSSSFSSSSSSASTAAAAAAAVSATSTFTGTIFSCRRGKVNFSIQSSAKTLDPMILFLELTVPSNILAREMREGDLKIAFEPNHIYCDPDLFSPLLSTPLWDMYCNGRKVGFAVKREPTKAELSALKVLNTVVEGAGVAIGEEMEPDARDHMMYLRVSFKRVFGSSGSESFHLIDPRGNIGRGLSIFFFQSSEWICISPNDRRWY